MRPESLRSCSRARSGEPGWWSTSSSRAATWSPPMTTAFGMEGRDRLRLRGGQALGQLRRIGLAGVERCLVDPGGHARERDAEPLEEGSASRGGAREDEVHAQCLCPASSWLPWCSRMCLASSAVK